jgi:hypothetical protein
LRPNLAAVAIDWLALVLIVVGAVEAFFLGLWTMFSSSEGHHEREVWLRLGRWLVAGLTFQLAADVLGTAITTSWDEARGLQRSPRSARSSTTFLTRPGRDQNAAERGAKRYRLTAAHAPVRPDNLRDDIS